MPAFFCKSRRGSASFFSDSSENATLYLYTQRKDGDQWHAFAKGTPDELRREIRPL
jgi:hypothetical protein